MVKKKLVIMSVGVILVVVGTFTLSKSFFEYHFTRLEKKQNQLAEEFNRIEEGTVPTQANASGSASFLTTQELGRLKKEIVAIQSQLDEQNSVLGLSDASPSATPVPDTQLQTHYVTISDRRWQRVDVFQDKKSSSSIIGQAVFGQAYPISKKENGYYYIALNETISGWINNQFVTEY